MRIFIFLLFFTSLNSEAFFGNKQRSYFANETDVSSICYAQGGHRILSSRECYKYIKNKKFDEDAVKVCGKHISSFEKYACVATIGNVVFDKKALKVCDKFRRPRDVNSCLKAIKNADIDIDQFKKCRNSSDNIDRSSFSYRVLTDAERTRAKSIGCLKKSRIPKQFDQCLTVTSGYISGYYNGKRTSTYSLSHDIIELVDSEVTLSEKKEELIKVKAITADFIWKNIVGQEFYVRADKVHFSDECRR